MCGLTSRMNTQCNDIYNTMYRYYIETSRDKLEVVWMHDGQYDGL